MTVKKHYDNHLGELYSWMAGDFEQKVFEFQHFLKTNQITPSESGVAIDLGAGHGIQSVALSELGYAVTAIDFNKQLLEELKTNAEGKQVKTILEDIRQVKKYARLKPELILCYGDTITHLDSQSDIEEFIGDCSDSLGEGGKLILSFRNYADELSGDQRFIPVKSDAERILTCFMEYESDRVNVTDLLHVKTEEGWIQKVSSYYKVRIKPNEVIRIMEENRFRITFYESVNGMQTLIAEKQKVGSWKIG